MSSMSMKFTNDIIHFIDNINRELGLSSVCFVRVSESVLYAHSL